MSPVVWLTGRPSSGKSTLGLALAAELRRRGQPCCLLDGDEVRDALVPRHGYDERGRDDYYATLARLAALLARQELVAVVAATSHLRSYRRRARAEAPSFVEVYVDAPVSECRRRDAKGLYAAVERSEISGLPGGDVGYEAPESPDVVARGGHDRQALQRIVLEVERLNTSLRPPDAPGLEPPRAPPRGPR